MKLYVDLESLQLIEGPGFRNPVTSLRFKRGDAAQLEVTFLDGGSTATSIGNPLALEIQFGIKPRNRYDIGYLVHDSVWTMPAIDAESPVYQCSPSFNTVELDSALGVGSATGTELSEITLMGEITWREGVGQPTSTRTFLVVVENDVNRGTEGVPISAEPAYPAPVSIALLSSIVRHDVAQSLGLPAKLQARQNIGADDFVTKPLLLTASPVKDSAVSISNVTLYAAGAGTPAIRNTGVLHLVSVDPDGRRIYTSSGYIEPTGYRFDQNLPGEMSSVSNLVEMYATDLDSYDDLESWIWPVGVTATVNEVPEASTIGQFAIVNETDLFIASSLAPTTWEPVRPDHESLQLAHSYGSDQIVAPYSPTLTIRTYSLPGRAGTLALNDGVGLGRSGSNLILGKITGITGSSNTGMGHNTLSSITSGSYNTAVGAQALGNCTSGMSNVAFGMEALQNLISVGQNSALGNSALSYVTVGVGNTGIGFRAGHSNVIGVQANLTQGKNNTLLGNSAGVNVNSRSQSIALGYRATTQADGELAIGAASAAIKGGTTGVTYNTTNHGIDYTVTAPGNPNTPVGWLDARINGTLFKIPLYQ